VHAQPVRVHRSFFSSGQVDWRGRYLA
jgi:hypothetical protein